MTVAVLTIAHGRHDHLRGLLAGCRRSDRAPDMVIVVAMSDPDIEDLAQDAWPGAIVEHLPTVDGALPLAAARNRAAQTAISRGATALVFLDVDCVPSPGLIGTYASAMEEATEPSVLAGDVAYLPEHERPYPVGELDRLAKPHPARPVLEPAQSRQADDVRLFWSLSFALSADSWTAIGGFDERYVGYGGEDTDFALRLQAAGASLVWVGGARAYHQFHENRMPPVHHLDDIVRNARIFHSTWGRWPMEGWLREFDRLGLVRFDGETLSGL